MGHNPGLDGIGKLATFPNEFRESRTRCDRFGIRACNGRFRWTESLSVAILASRDAIAKTPLPPEVSRFLARIMGESYDSGHGLGSDGSRNNGISSVCSRTNSGKSRNPLPERTIGLKMGDFPLSLFCPRDRSCDAKCLKRTPLLLMGRISVR